MSLLENSYLHDGIKAGIYFVPLIYLVVRQKQLQLKYFWLLCSGLLLLFIGHVLDFSDEFKQIEHVFIIGKKSPYHDVYEDVVGFSLGFALCSMGVFLEFFHGKNAEKNKNRP